VVTQREIGTHPQLLEALQNAVREDPDVIMLGNSAISSIAWPDRGRDRIQILGTSTPTGLRTIDRIVNVFPARRRNRSLHAGESLRMIVSQQLVPNVDGSAHPRRRVCSTPTPPRHDPPRTATSSVR
jgi:Tfp pilus assembly pilus retraction ATPase PilT